MSRDVGHARPALPQPFRSHTVCVTLRGCELGKKHGTGARLTQVGGKQVMSAREQAGVTDSLQEPGSALMENRKHVVKLGQGTSCSLYPHAFPMDTGSSQSLPAPQ